MAFPAEWAARRRDGRPREREAGRIALAILTVATLISLVSVAALSLGVLTGRLPASATLTSTATPAASPSGDRGEGSARPASARPPER